MHYSEDGGIPPDADAGGPFDSLLIKDNVSVLCLVCHDNGGFPNAPDVHGSDFWGLTERSAGHFGAIDTENPNGHNLGLDKIGSSNFCLTCHFGGDFNTAKIGCTNCHEAHGRDHSNPEYRYRNLQWASSPGGEPIITAFMNPSATGLEVYERDNIGYTAPTTQTSTWREVSNICLDCHHTFSGYVYTREDGSESGHPIKHPVTDTERGAWEQINKHDSTDPPHWVGATEHLPFIVSGATNFAEATTVAEDNEVFCLTCHNAHGSDNSSAMRWSYRVGSNEGCQLCHNKGN
jgi:hypothetical protein